jgi:hypothetical protein
MATPPENLIATAAAPVDIEPLIGSASPRGAISTACNAVLSRLSTLCASRAARSGRTTDDFKAIYRTLEHAQARKVLTAHDEVNDPIGDALERLQIVRQWADDSNDSHPESDKAVLGETFARAEALRLVELSRQTIATINALSADARQRLTVALITRSRR